MTASLLHSAATSGRSPSALARAREPRPGLLRGHHATLLITDSVLPLPFLQRRGKQATCPDKILKYSTAAQPSSPTAKHQPAALSKSHRVGHPTSAASGDILAGCMQVPLLHTDKTKPTQESQNLGSRRSQHGIDGLLRWRP